MVIGADGFMSQLARRAAAAAARIFFFRCSRLGSAAFPRDLEFDRVERAFSDRYSGFSLFVSRQNSSGETKPHLRLGDRRGAAQCRILAFALSRRSDSGENKPFAGPQERRAYLRQPHRFSRPRERPLSFSKQASSSTATKS